MIPSIVLSVKTEFADLIIDGDKTLELRKKPFSADKVRALIYSSGKDKKIIGACNLEFSYFHSAPLCKYLLDSSYDNDLEIIPILRKLCLFAVDVEEYIKDGTPWVYEVSDVVKFPEPLDLVHFGLTHAPQSWAYARCIPASLLGVSS